MHGTLALRCLLVSTLALAGATGCHRHTGPKAKVVTSIFPVYDLTRRIAGEDADVTMLEPIAESPHQYAPSPGDMDRATGTTLAILVGFDLDAWMPPMMARMAPKARLLKLADRVPTLPRVPALGEETHQAKREAARRRDPDDPNLADPIDPHVWLDPQRALLMARAIGEELCRVDPSNAKGYRTRTLEVTKSLDALDHETEARTSTWKQHAFATLHDGFRYYAARYHLDVVVALEAKPGVKPSIRTDQLLLARIREHSAAGVFGEPQLDSQPAKTLAQASGLPYGVLDPVGGGAGVDSYEALIRFDTDVLEKALSLAPPPPSAPPPSASAASASP